MHRTALSVAVLAWSLLGPVASQNAAAQDQPVPGKKILKQEVDGLIRLLTASAADDGVIAGSARHTAMVLTAAGHCHRFYYDGDGPWIRRALQALFAHRRADGWFADGADDDAAVTTRWVAAALEVMNPERYAGEVTRARTLLTKQEAAADSPFDARLHELAAAVADQADPPSALENLARARLGQLPQGALHGAPADPAELVAALVEITAAQSLARSGGRLAPAGQDAAAPAPAWHAVQQRGFDYLLTQQERGIFYVQFGDQRFPNAGLTAMGLAALQTKPKAERTEAEQTTIDQGLAFLISQQDEQGGFGADNVNYTTCASIMALAAADDARYADALSKAQRFVLFLQNIEDRNYGRADRDYGSIGYGGDQRGDLSNLQFALQALRETELDPQHEAFGKALVFLQRLQNLESVNDFSERTRDENGEWQRVSSGNDGGAAYYPGNSPAGYESLADGTRIPRSYGSMTYALLKAYILCGLTPTDPRVQAAVRWIQQNWTLDVNPGADAALGEKAAYQGLYYYYMVLAQALDLVGLDEVTPAKLAEATTAPAAVSWRGALRTHLESLQQRDGSWVNAHNGRWWEDQPLVCTAYAMLALGRCGG